MNLTKVTVTGADDSVDPEDLLALANKYPFVEFGILLSEKAVHTGLNRFPSSPWLAALNSLSDGFNLKLSAHICGRWVRDILIGKWTVFKHDPTLYSFQRIQLNFHAAAQMCDEDKFVKGFYDERLQGKQIIFQRDGVNHLFYVIAEHAGFNVVPLFDLSHGTGILPDNWPSADQFVRGAGYAGGLSPENVAGELEKISQVSGEKEIWIDAETHLRSDNDQRFDLDKVEAFLEAAKPFVRTK